MNYFWNPRNNFQTVLFASAVYVCLCICGFAQSSLPDHPTPITRNEVNGIIRARDLGDARLTTHYYWFEGSQGDVFINLTSKNFAGDIDVFAQNGLKPLTKIVVYADFGEVETGRVIYLRKPERLVLRVQGRTPSDEAATYQLKFAGSFVAAVGDESDVPAMPTVNDTVSGAVRVNSVGTILPPLPKPVVEKADVDDKSENVKSESGRSESKGAEEAAKVTTSENRGEESKPESKPKLEVVVDDPTASAKSSTAVTPAKRPPVRNRNSRNNAAKNVESPKSDGVKEELEKKVVQSGTDTAKADAEHPKASTSGKAEPKADPLANVRLVIVFKDGAKIERPLPDVFKFSVDRGVLTVISKDGRVGKYQMVDVAKVTIE
jgi:hypothetical protein